MSQNYYSKLDVFRFIAIFLVLIEHFAIVISRNISAGYYGVDMFFVLSGFLITGILMKSTNSSALKSWINFLGRRALRIFPVYYLTILVLFILGYSPVIDNLAVLIFYFYNYAWVAYEIPLSGVSHFWSLAVEEQFYFIWPALVLFVFRKNNNRILISAFIIYLMCTLQLIFNIIPNVSKFNGVGLFPQANSLLLGAIGAILFKQNKLPFKLLENKAIEISAYIMLVLVLTIDSEIKYFIAPLISLFLIFKCVTGTFQFESVNRFFSIKQLIYLGSISYGIYIYHLPLDYYLSKYLFDPFIWDKINFSNLGSLSKLEFHPWIIKFPLYSVISIICAHYSFQYFEKPILKYKDKFFPN